MKDHFLILARASAWANDLLGAELAGLSPPQWTHASAANFGSLQGIANHLILADRVWLQRFSGQGEPVSTPISTVDAVPYPDIPGCLAARQAEDQRVIAFAEALDPARLGATLRYTAMNGSPCAEPFSVCLAHFYNHQTFHRGQLHALLGTLGIRAPNLDLIYYLHQGSAARAARVSPR